MFTKLRLPQEFLKLPASQWAENHDYQTAADVARAVAFVERGVALIQHFQKS